MFKVRTLWVVAALIAILLAAMVISSCSKKSEGPEPVNDAPVVSIVNVPPSGSHFTTSPVINWFGTDADGYIVVYEYAVIRASVLAAAVDTSNPAAVIAYANEAIDLPGPTSPCDPGCWNIIDVKNTDNPSRQEIRLLAGNTPQDSVVQYFFVRAIDDDSVRSITQYSVYSRNNNPPSTEITTVPDTTFYYDLPETTAVYRGILMEWKGNDQIDFPNIADQPPFTYYYQVFGPYTHKSLDYDSLGAPGPGFAIDTTNIEKLVVTSRDTTSGSVWVSNTSARFYNLWRAAPASDTTIIADFVLKVVSRDDASAADPTPEYKVFTAVFPKFEKRVLLFTPSFCVGNFSPGEIPCVYDSYYKDLPYRIYDERDMVAAYKRIFAAAGYPDADTMHINIGPIAPDNPFIIPGKEIYGKYQVVVLLHDGNKPRTSPIYFANLTDYMDIGGNMWIWSPAAFSVVTLIEEKLQSLLEKSKQTYLANYWPTYYFDVTGEYRGFWTNSYTTRANYFDDSVATAPKTIEQFTGGLTLMPGEFDNFKMDLERVQLLYYFLRDSQDELDTLRFRGAPNTSYFIRDVFSEPVFLYESFFGSSIPAEYQKYCKQLQGTVVAVRNNTSVFKTAVFGFSAFCTKEEDAVKIAQRMMSWFLN